MVLVVGVDVAVVIVIAVAAAVAVVARVGCAKIGCLLHCREACLSTCGITHRIMLRTVASGLYGSTTVVMLR